MQGRAVSRTARTPTKVKAQRPAARRVHTKPTHAHPKRSQTAALTTAKRHMSAADAPKVPNFINGKLVESKAKMWIPLYNPSTGEVIGQVPQTTPEEHKAAVDGAKLAQQAWKDVPTTVRQRHCFDLINLIHRNEQEIVESIVKETGKTLADAKGDIFRGVEVLEFACGTANHMKGETLEQVARDVDTYTYRQPLGVVGSVNPFNFPAMIPLWKISLALTTGNALILKPSEKCPTAALIFARLAKEAGYPDGILQIVNGAHDTVNFLCDEPEIKAVSFVGANTAGEHIANRCAANGKRYQCNMAAKNHGSFLPDADKDQALNALVGAAFGAGGQRCMKTAVALLIGDAKEWITDIVAKAEALQVGPSENEASSFGPVISKQSYDLIHAQIASAEEEGAKIVLDGRNPKNIPEKYKNGYYIGPTIIADVKPHMRCYREEIFGPALVTMNVKDLDEAIQVTNDNAWGNGAFLFTNSGAAARKFQHEIAPSQIGINIPIPIAPAFFSFTSNKGSFRGTHNFYGKEGVRFYTEERTITSLWRTTPENTGVAMAFPTTRH